MLNVAATEMILNELHIRTLVGGREAIGMAELVEKGKQRKGGGLFVLLAAFFVETHPAAPALHKTVAHR